MFNYGYKPDAYGGFVIRQSLAGVPMREKYIQPGDDASRFITDIEQAEGKSLYGNPITQILMDGYFD